MEKTSNSTEQKKLETVSSSQGPVWLKQNEELIAKLESAYETPIETNEQDTKARFYGFQVGDINLLIDDSTPCELLEDNQVYPIPFATEWMVGVSNVRGDAIPVINLEQMITANMEQKSSKNGNVIIINKDENAIGLQLENLPINKAFDDDELLEDLNDVPEQIRPFVTKAYSNNGTIWARINFLEFFKSLNE